MARTNAELSEALQRVADLLQSEDPTSVRAHAWHRAARTVASLSEELSARIARGDDLARVPGIAMEVAVRLRELVRSGELTTLEMPSAVRPSQPPRLPPRRFRLSVAAQAAVPLVAWLRMLPGVLAADAAGSFRRRCETVGDFDVLVASPAAAQVVERFVRHDDVQRVTVRQATRAQVVLASGLCVDLRVVPPASYGAALLCFTGSSSHLAALRRIAHERGLELREHGLFRGGQRIAGRSEDEVYRALGMAPVPPELREERGEIAASLEQRLPRLVEAGDIRGDLHAHTDASDGKSSLGEMVEAARAHGYEYVAITDHTEGPRGPGGLDAKWLGRQLEQIDRMNAKLRGFTILKSAEVDILGDGSLGLPDDILRELDFCVCGIHSELDLPVGKQTDRVLRAMDNRHFSVFAHPTGRRVGEPRRCAVDLDRLMCAARDRGCCLEVNAQPERLDLGDVGCRRAKELGVKVVVSTDAHRASDFAVMGYGVDQARRGWLGPDDVLNTRGVDEVRSLLRRG